MFIVYLIHIMLWYWIFHSHTYHQLIHVDSSLGMLQARIDRAVVITVKSDRMMPKLIEIHSNLHSQKWSKSITRSFIKRLELVYSMSAILNGDHEVCRRFWGPTHAKASPNRNPGVTQHLTCDVAVTVTLPLYNYSLLGLLKGRWENCVK
jgi:hypothetical protein